MKSKINISSIFIPVVGFIICIGIWQGLTVWMNIPSYLLPSPYEIFKSFQENTPEIAANYLVTLSESFLGVVLGSVIGFIIGVAMAESSFFRKLSLPFLIASNAIPIIAIAPIIIIWFGNTLTAKVMVASFISFFPIALSSYRGLSEFRPYFKELFDTYGATRNQFLFKYKMGNAVPYIMTGLKLNATLSVIGAIVGEFVSSNKGLGFGILQASYNFNSAKLWGYIFLACSIGVGFYIIIYILEKKLLHKFKIN